MYKTVLFFSALFFISCTSDKTIDSENSIDTEVLETESNSEITEDQKIEEMLKKDKQKLDSMKKALLVD